MGKNEGGGIVLGVSQKNKPPTLKNLESRFC
jgi:hypothetical protein